MNFSVKSNKKSFAQKSTQKSELLKKVLKKVVVVFDRFSDFLLPNYGCFCEGTSDAAKILAPPHYRDTVSQKQPQHSQPAGWKMTIIKV